MANLNRIILVGRLTADPDSRSVLDGLPLTKFRLAVDRPQNGTDLIDIIAWRQVAEVCGDRLRKGTMVLVEGRIQNRSFEDQNGQRRWVTEVVARNVAPLEKGAAPARQAAAQPATEEGAEAIEDIDLTSDLPF